MNNMCIDEEFKSLDKNKFKDDIIGYLVSDVYLLSIKNLSKTKKVNKEEIYKALKAMFLDIIIRNLDCFDNEFFADLKYFLNSEEYKKQLNDVSSSNNVSTILLETNFKSSLFDEMIKLDLVDKYIHPINGLFGIKKMSEEEIDRSFKAIILDIVIISNFNIFIDFNFFTNLKSYLTSERYKKRLNDVSLSKNISINLVETNFKSSLIDNVIQDELRKNELFNKDNKSPNNYKHIITDSGSITNNNTDEIIKDTVNPPTAESIIGVKQGKTPDCDINSRIDTMKYEEQASYLNNILLKIESSKHEIIYDTHEMYKVIKEIKQTNIKKSCDIEKLKYDYESISKELNGASFNIREILALQKEANEILERTHEEVETYTDNTEIKKNIFEYINKATEYIYISIFSFTDIELIELLINKSKNVKIKIIMDANKYTESLNGIRGNSGSGGKPRKNLELENKFGSLVSNDNVKFRVTKDDKEKGCMHKKETVIDGKYTLSGTANYTYSGLNYNSERLYIFKLEETAIAHEKDFHEMWKNAEIRS